LKVSVLGLGIIGSAWARNLIDDHCDVRTWNRTPKDFPGFCTSVSEAVRDAQFIIVVVSDPEAVQSVVDQMVPALTAGQVVIQSSTVSSDWSRRYAEQVTRMGAQFLEAPFTGSKPAAEARKTVFYLGGAQPVIDNARPLLERLSSHRLTIGEIGSASSLKLAMNLNIAGAAQSLCESVALARAAGIADEIYFQALHINAGRSGVSDLKEPKLKTNDFSPQFSVKHMAKDLRLVQETALGFGLSLDVAQMLSEVYRKAMDQGLGEDDFIGLIRLLAQTERR